MNIELDGSTYPSVTVVGDTIRIVYTGKARAGTREP
jgi:hypothetical protein